MTSFGVAVGSPCRLMPSQTDANTEYMLSHDARSPSDGHATTRVVLCRHVSISPPQRDLMANAAFLAVYGGGFLTAYGRTDRAREFRPYLHFNLKLRRQILRIQIESIGLLLGPELGNLERNNIMTVWGMRQYNSHSKVIEKFKRCAWCSAYYCSSECQPVDWRATHRQVETPVGVA
ncbi:hypothetical protein B0H13DRAFT_1912576 [Mycena leptocephala]|nr:hypothetical protein B0H13DRAFT_1912576 [Mycena leptocephala]